MKKATVFLIAIFISGVLSAQTENSFKYVVKTKGGIINTLKGLAADKVDSIKVAGGNVTHYQGGDTLNPTVPYANRLALFDVAMKLYPDTALVTAAVFRPNLTHLNTYIRVNRASQVIVYLPPDSTVNFPIGSTLNFKMDNAGIVTFKGSNSRIEAKKDSATINFKGGWATAIKRAANKWDLLGDLTD